MLYKSEQFIRDDDNPGAVLNTDRSSLEQYKHLKTLYRKLNRVDQLIKRIEQLEAMVQRLEKQIELITK